MYLPLGTDLFIPPLEDTSAAPVVTVSPTSDRLQLLEPFPAWNGRDWKVRPRRFRTRSTVLFCNLIGVTCFRAVRRAGLTGACQG